MLVFFHQACWAPHPLWCQWLRFWKYLENNTSPSILTHNEVSYLLVLSFNGLPTAAILARPESMRLTSEGQTFHIVATCGRWNPIQSWRNPAFRRTHTGSCPNPEVQKGSVGNLEGELSKPGVRSCRGGSPSNVHHGLALALGQVGGRLWNTSSGFLWFQPRLQVQRALPPALWGCR